MDNLKTISEAEIDEFSNFLLNYPSLDQPFSYVMCKRNNNSNELKKIVRSTLLTKLLKESDFLKIFTKLDVYMNDIFLGPSDVALMLGEPSDIRKSRMDRQIQNKIVSFLDAFVWESPNPRKFKGNIPTIGSSSSKDLIGNGFDSFYSDTLGVKEGTSYDFIADMDEVEVVALYRKNKYIGHIFYNFNTSSFMGIRKSFDEIINPSIYNFRTHMLAAVSDRASIYGHETIGIAGPAVGKMTKADILHQNEAENSLDNPPKDFVRIPKFVQNVDKMKNSSLEQIKKEKNPNECIKFGQKFPQAKGVKVPRFGQSKR